MDLSKLPKLSQSKSVAPSAPQPQSAEPVEPVDYASRCPAPSHTTFAAEVWIGVIIGLVLVLYTRAFAGYLIALATGHPFHTGVEWTTGPNAGAEVPYTQLEGGTFYSDSSIFFFGIALIIGAVTQALLATRLRAKTAFGWASILCMFVATAYSAVAAVILLNHGITPLLSILCVGVGVYLLFYEWQALRATK